MEHNENHLHSRAQHLKYSLLSWWGGVMSSHRRSQAQGACLLLFQSVVVEIILLQRSVSITNFFRDGVVEDKLDQFNTNSILNVVMITTFSINSLIILTGCFGFLLSLHHKDLAASFICDKLLGFSLLSYQYLMIIPATNASLQFLPNVLSTLNLLFTFLVGTFAIISDFDYSLKLNSREDIDYLAKENDFRSAVIRFMLQIMICISINYGAKGLIVAICLIFALILLLQNAFKQVLRVEKARSLSIFLNLTISLTAIGVFFEDRFSQPSFLPLYLLAAVPLSYKISILIERKQTEISIMSVIRRITETNRHNPAKLSRIVTSLVKNMRFDYSSYSQSVHSAVLEAMMANHISVCAKYPDCFCAQSDVLLKHKLLQRNLPKIKQQGFFTSKSDKDNTSWECRIGEKTRQDQLMNLINELLSKERKEIRLVKGRRTTISTNLDFIHANFLISISQSRVLAIMNLHKLGTSKKLAINEQMYVHRLRLLLEKTFPHQSEQTSVLQESMEFDESLKKLFILYESCINGKLHMVSHFSKDFIDLSKLETNALTLLKKKKKFIKEITRLSQISQNNPVLCSLIEGYVLNFSFAMDTDYQKQADKSIQPRRTYSQHDKQLITEDAFVFHKNSMLPIQLMNYLDRSNGILTYSNHQSVINKLNIFNEQSFTIQIGATGKKLGYVQKAQFQFYDIFGYKTKQFSHINQIIPDYIAKFHHVLLEHYITNFDSSKNTNNGKKFDIIIALKQNGWGIPVKMQFQILQPFLYEDAKFVSLIRPIISNNLYVMIDPQTKQILLAGESFYNTFFSNILLINEFNSVYLSRIIPYLTTKLTSNPTILHQAMLFIPKDPSSNGVTLLTSPLDKSKLQNYITTISLSTHEIFSAFFRLHSITNALVPYYILEIEQHSKLEQVIDIVNALKLFQAQTKEVYGQQIEFDDHFFDEDEVVFTSSSSSSSSSQSSKGQRNDIAYYESQDENINENINQDLLHSLRSKRNSRKIVKILMKSENNNNNYKEERLLSKHLHAKHGGLNSMDTQVFTSNWHTHTVEEKGIILIDHSQIGSDNDSRRFDMQRLLSLDGITTSPQLLAQKQEDESEMNGEIELRQLRKHSKNDDKEFKNSKKIIFNDVSTNVHDQQGIILLSQKHKLLHQRQSLHSPVNEERVEFKSEFSRQLSPPKLTEEKIQDLKKQLSFKEKLASIKQQLTQKSTTSYRISGSMLNDNFETRRFLSTENIPQSTKDIGALSKEDQSSTPSLKEFEDKEIVNNLETIEQTGIQLRQQQQQTHRLHDIITTPNQNSQYHKSETIRRLKSHLLDNDDESSDSQETSHQSANRQKQVFALRLSTVKQKPQLIWLRGISIFGIACLLLVTIYSYITVAELFRLEKQHFKNIAWPMELRTSMTLPTYYLQYLKFYDNDIFSQHSDSDWQSFQLINQQRIEALRIKYYSLYEFFINANKDDYPYFKNITTYEFSYFLFKDFMTYGKIISTDQTISLQYFIPMWLGNVERYFQDLPHTQTEEAMRSENFAKFVVPMDSLQNGITSETLAVLDSIEQTVFVNMICDFALSCGIILTIFPAFANAQIKREKLLKLFASFSPEDMHHILSNLNRSISKLRLMAIRFHNFLPSVMVAMTNSQSQSTSLQPEQRVKKKTLASTTSLNKVSISMIGLSVLVFLILSIQPSLNTIIISSLTNEQRANLTLMKTIYSMKAHFASNLFLNMGNILEEMCSTCEFYDRTYFKRRIPVYFQENQNKLSNLYSTMQQTTTTTRYKQSLYSSFLYELMEGNLCSVLDRFPEYIQDAAFTLDIAKCQSIQQGMLQKGFEISVKYLIELFPPLYALTLDADTTKVRADIVAWVDELNLLEFDNFTNIIIISITAIKNFMITISDDYLTYVTTIELYLISFYCLTIALLLYFLGVRFHNSMIESLLISEQLLSLLDLSTLYRNIYIFNYISKKKHY